MSKKNKTLLFERKQHNSNKSAELKYILDTVYKKEALLNNNDCLVIKISHSFFSLNPFIVYTEVPDHFGQFPRQVYLELPFFKNL